jgi:hypothetical protein
MAWKIDTFNCVLLTVICVKTRICTLLLLCVCVRVHVCVCVCVCVCACVCCWDQTQGLTCARQGLCH